MKRRALLEALGTLAVAGPSATRAQRLPRIGFLVAGDPEPTWTLFRKAMAALGYEDGRNIVFEFRAADAASGRLDTDARELVGLPVDVIVAVLSPAVAAAQKATSTLPIVFIGGAPLTGAVGNLARPEGNLTGAFSPSSIIAGKGLQLFHEMKPAARSIGLLLNEIDPFHVPLRRDTEAAARTEQIEPVVVLVKSKDDLPAAFESLVRRGVDGALIQPTLGLEMCAALALKVRLPAFSFRREFAEVGGLMSYGADQAEITRAVAGQVVRILKGARPGDLPVQQASRFELIVNQKTARALGLTIPPLFLARADEVIE